jgi:hypothetical protein
MDLIVICRVIHAANVEAVDMLVLVYLFSII